MQKLPPLVQLCTDLAMATLKKRAEGIMARRIIWPTSEKTQNSNLSKEILFRSFLLFVALFLSCWLIPGSLRLFGLVRSSGLRAVSEARF